MEQLKVQMDGEFIASVPLELDGLTREAIWEHEETKVRASRSNETLSLQVVSGEEPVMVFVGKVAAPVTFNCKVPGGSNLILTLD